MRFFRLKLFVTKWSHYEYWPWLFFYIPSIPVYLYYAIRSGYFFFTTAANPGIENGGLYGESKMDILNNFSDDYKPKTLIHKYGSSVQETMNVLVARGFEWPFIVKPDAGQRGLMVQKIYEPKALEEILQANAYDFIIQEFIDYPLEFGVLYGRLPGHEHGSVRSIVSKGFLSVTGDGIHTVEHLLLQNKRAWFQMDRFKVEIPGLLKTVLSKGEIKIIEPIGNHCKGTEFINSNDLISEELNRVFDKISKQFNGFYYGRFDMKVRSIEEFKKGETIKIFELNGVTSDAGHIYDKDYTLIKAYKDIVKEMNFIYKISVLNIKNGVKPIRAGFMIPFIFNYFKKQNYTEHFL